MLTECRQCDWEELCSGSKAGRSLDLPCGGEEGARFLTLKEGKEREILQEVPLPLTSFSRPFNTVTGLRSLAFVWGGSLRPWILNIESSFKALQTTPGLFMLICYLIFRFHLRRKWVRSCADSHFLSPALEGREMGRFEDPWIPVLWREYLSLVSELGKALEEISSGI
jgi:hypothetical protein